MSTSSRAALLRSLPAASAPSQSGDPVVDELRALRSEVRTLNQSRLIRQPVRTIARGIILGYLAVIGVAVVFGIIWAIGAYMTSRGHW